MQPSTGRPVLGLDSTGAACSAAVIGGEGTVLGHVFRPVDRGHAEVLMPVVIEAMAAARLSFADLAGLAVTVGPGSFTGVRAGLAAARGLALASSLPLIGITTFMALARAAPQRRAGELLLLVLDTKRRDLYAEAYGNRGEIVMAGAVRQPGELADLLPDGPILTVGDAAAGATAALNDAGRVARCFEIPAVDAVHVAALGSDRLAEAVPTYSPDPLYLRSAEATLPAAGGRLRG